MIHPDIPPEFINQIVTGDARELAKRLPDESIDLIVTSPPYDSLRTYDGYIFDFEGIAAELWRVTKRGGVIVWVVGDETINGSESGTSFKQALYFMGLGFNLHDTMIYEKANFSNPSINRYHQIFEYMFVLSKNTPKTFNAIRDHHNKYGAPFGRNTARQADGALIERRKNEPREMGMRTNIWRMNTVGQEMMCKTPPHPAMFPDALARDHILSWSNPGDTVLDPMCGSGTTCKESKRNGRHFIGFDISLNYCEIARARVANTNPPLFVLQPEQLALAEP